MLFHITDLQAFRIGKNGKTTYCFDQSVNLPTRRRASTIISSGRSKKMCHLQMERKNVIRLSCAGGIEFVSQLLKVTRQQSRQRPNGFDDILGLTNRWSGNLSFPELQRRVLSQITLKSLLSIDEDEISRSNNLGFISEQTYSVYRWTEESMAHRLNFHVSRTPRGAPENHGSFHLDLKIKYFGHLVIDFTT